MRNVAVLLTVMIFVATPALADLTKVAENVYSYVGAGSPNPANSFGANAGIVVGREGILVVDTLVSAKEARRLLADIRKVSDKPIKYVVNTHTHLDHAFGNSVFADRGAIIISHAADRAFLEKMGETTLQNSSAFGLKPEDMAGTRISLPTLAFSDRLTIDLGGETVELVHLAPSHTEGSILVQIPARKVLFSGDILFTDFHPYLADGDITGWIQVLDAMLVLDVEKIIPGHGPLSTKKDLRDMREYLLAFDAKAREMTATGAGNVEELAVALKQALPKRSLADWMIPINLKSRYLPKE